MIPPTFLWTLKNPSSIKHWQITLFLKVPNIPGHWTWSLKNEFLIYGKILAGTGEALHYFRKLHSIFTRSFCPISGLINEVKYRSSPRGVVKFSNQNKSIETACLTPQQRKSDDADVFGLVKSPVFSSPSLCSKPFLPQKTYFYCQLEQYNVSLFLKRRDDRRVDVNNGKTL